MSDIGYETTQTVMPTTSPSLTTANAVSHGPLLCNRVTKAQTGVDGWGWLPTISCLSALGLVIVALAYNGGREERAWATGLYWVGLLVMFAPIAVRLFMDNVPRRERIGLVLFLGLELYLVKVIYSPLEYKFTDEFLHWRTASEMLQSGRLFEFNFMLPISPLYPGLEIVATALTSVSGLTIFDAGLIVLGVSRLVLTLALFFLYEQSTKSAQMAGIASVLYMTNPHFQFFDSMFAYQSLALPLAVLALFMAVRVMHAQDSNQLGLKLALLLSLITVVVTHHMTSYALVIFLFVWTAAALYVRRSDPKQLIPSGIALLTLVLILAWIVYVASVTIDYIVPPLDRAIIQIASMIARDMSIAEVFRPPAGPLWEGIASLTTVGLIVLVLPIGIWYIWKRHRANSVALAMAIGSLGYYLSLVVRLSAQGAELTGRSWSFLFLAVAFVLAVAVIETKQKSYHRLLPAKTVHILLPGMAVMLFVGGIASGWPPFWARLPGPYLVAAFERSVERQSVSTAYWTRDVLGAGHRMAADFSNYALLGAYGEQDAIRGLSDVYFARQLGASERKEIRLQDVQYVLVDFRLSRSLPASGRYFEPQEPDAYRHVSPIDTAALAKFDGETGVGRIFDSGDIVIYDVGSLVYAP